MRCWNIWRCWGPIKKKEKAQRDEPDYEAIIRAELETLNEDADGVLDIMSACWEASYGGARPFYYKRTIEWRDYFFENSDEFSGAFHCKIWEKWRFGQTWIEGDEDTDEYSVIVGEISLRPGNETPFQTAYQIAAYDIACLGTQRVADWIEARWEYQLGEVPGEELGPEPSPMVVNGRTYGGGYVQATSDSSIDVGVIINWTSYILSMENNNLVYIYSFIKEKIK